MIIEIDQSGKIENTNKPTVLAFSNSISKSILISAKDKRTIQTIYRKINQGKTFITKIFSTMIFYLLKSDIKNLDSIIIDREYPGHESDIKSSILDIFNKEKIKIEPGSIKFTSIGKKSNAHKIAHESYISKKSEIKISANEILRILLK